MSAAMRRGNDVPPPEVHMNKVSVSTLQRNGSGPPSLNYVTEPSDDENMNEILGEKMDLHVFLPDGRSTDISIDSNIPMMDLLVNLAASSKLNPASYTLILLSQNKKKPIEYKANQTIGSLNMDDGTVLTVQLVPKKTDSDKKGKSKDVNKPFEVTYRFIVNLPRSQKKILRISPNTTLEQVYLTVCEERHLDPSNYILEHPATGEPLINLRATVGDLRINEVNFVNASVIDSTKSMPNLHRGSSLKTGHHDGPPGKGEKKKRGFFSFLRKDKKQKLYDIPVEPRETGKRRPASMAAADFEHVASRRMEALDSNSRPKTMFVSGIDIEQSSTAVVEKPIDNIQPGKGIVTQEGRKRRAPPPPQKVPPTNVIQVEVNIEEKSTSREPTDQKVNSVNASKTSNEQLVQRLHSRNSSDSSGYHELTLSGPESPEAERIAENYDNFKTSLDSTSIESVQLNGDSGIRDVSPPRRKEGASDTAQYKSQTLPLDKDRSKIKNNRSRTLDRAEVKEKQAPSGKKKKAPPPPPGGPQVIPQSTSTVPVTSPTCALPNRTDAPSTFSDIQSRNQRKEDDENPDKMLMEEDFSITTEEIETDIPKAPRPCPFIAPPPPDTPPPPDSKPVDYSEVVGQRTDTVDIGVGEDTTSIHSHKSSPVSIHSCADSHTSMSSVNTLEDLSMAFDLTIAVAEEAMMNLESSTKDNLSSNSMPKQSKDDVIATKITDVSQTDEIDKNSDSGSMVIHIADEMPDNAIKTKIENVDREIEVTVREDNYRINNSTRRNESDEMSYKNNVKLLPSEIQSEVHMDILNDQEEEEYTESIEEVIFPISGQGCPRRIPDFDTPKEPSVVVHSSVTEHQTEMDFPVDIEDEREPLQFDPEIEEEHVEKEKEEIILTLDDLHNVDFGGPRKPKVELEFKPKVELEFKPKVELEFKQQPDNEYSKKDEVTCYDYEDQYKPEVNVMPYKDYESDGNNGSICGARGSVRGFKGSVKNRCTEISFSPKTESELENVLEEKSISMIALPAMRVKRVEEPCKYPTYSSSANLLISSNASEMLDHDYKFSVPSKLPDEPEFNYDNVSKLPDEPEINYENDVSKFTGESVLKFECNVENVQEESDLDQSQIEEQQETLRIQFEQLQDQMSQWQAQLEENQRLLESQTMDPVDREIQLQQIQMYRDMMFQLQQNIEALNIQQQQLKEQQALVSPDRVVSGHSSNSDDTVVATVVHIKEEKVQNVEAGIQEMAPAPPPLPVSQPQLDVKVPRNFSPTAMNSALLFPKPFKPREEKSKSNSMRRFEPKLDPREELMIAIRNYGGWSGLKRVPVKETKWHNSR